MKAGQPKRKSEDPQIWWCGDAACLPQTAFLLTGQKETPIWLSNCGLSFLLCTAAIIADLCIRGQQMSPWTRRRRKQQLHLFGGIFQFSVVARFHQHWMNTNLFELTCGNGSLRGGEQTALGETAMWPAVKHTALWMLKCWKSACLFREVEAIPKNLTATFPTRTGDAVFSEGRVFFSETADTSMPSFWNSGRAVFYRHYREHPGHRLPISSQILCSQKHRQAMKAPLKTLPSTQCFWWAISTSRLTPQTPPEKPQLPPPLPLPDTFIFIPVSLAKPNKLKWENGFTK